MDTGTPPKLLNAPSNPEATSAASFTKTTTDGL